MSKLYTFRDTDILRGPMDEGYRQDYVLVEDADEVEAGGAWLTREGVQSIVNQWHDKQLEDGAGVFNMDLNGLLNEIFGDAP